MDADKQEKDVTLIELVENPDLLELGDTQESQQREKVKELVDIETYKAQVKANDGNFDNNLLLCKLQWVKHSNTTSMPKFYRSEHNRTILQKTVIDALTACRNSGLLPPIVIEFSSIDVIPLGILLDCEKMESDQFQLIVQQKGFKEQLKVTLETENAWGSMEKFEEPLTLTLGRYATEVEQKFVFSLTFTGPMVPYKVTDEQGKIRKVTRPPTSAMVHHAFCEFGTPCYRSETSFRDTFYLDDATTEGAGKNRWTAFYEHGPTQTLPLFYTLPDGEGDRISAWAFTSKCYQLDVINVCNFCRANMDEVQEGGTHECTRVGSLVPSFRKDVQKKQYEVKQKSLKSILKAKKQQAAMKQHMEKLQAERKTRDAAHNTQLSQLQLTPPHKKTAGKGE